MKMKKYNLTLFVSYVGYVIQALVINFAPLLFITFSEEYNLTLSQISTLVVVNFTSQLTMDFLSTWYVDRLGYRKTALAAHISATLGIAGLAFLPQIMPTPFSGLLISMVLCGMGGGIIEVIVSPIVEALPTKSKSASMSLLHSFYSWGQLLTVLLSTVFFLKIGIGSWKILALLWALVPFINGILFTFVPIVPLVKEGEKGLTVKEILKVRVFYVFAVAMLAGGAAEQAIIQWASAYAESGLGISKTAGDLLGPCVFAFLMGLSRVFYSLFHEKIKLINFMIGSSALLMISFLMTSLCENPVLSLSGCALSGLAVGIAWPGMLSLTSRHIKNGGTAMFAILAFFGDVGCIIGPGITGWVSDMAGGNMRSGFLVSVIYPLMMLSMLLIICRLKRKRRI
ncbi:MAG: MFS transporter [Clostridia bacterium]|nr:MFS transporter [Clostridia bacterium]